MNGSDVHFILPSSLKHDVIDGVDVYYATAYMYGFSFSVSVHAGQDVISAIVPTFNGVEDADLVLTQSGDGEYAVTDRAVVRRGNYAYGVKVRTSKGRVYDRFFHLKILSAYSKAVLNYTSLSTYGLHENLSKLRVVAHVNAGDHVDRVKLSRRFNLGELVELGDMQVNGDVYEYEDLLFDVVDRGGTVEYVATVITSTDATWCRSISVPFTRSSLSPNTIVAKVNDDTHLVYGGVTCRVSNELSVFNNEIVVITANVNDDSSTINIATVDGHWSMYAENLRTTWPAVFNKNVTDASPNVFTFTGNCVVVLVDGDSSTSSTGVFTCTMTCGDNVYVKFAVTAEDDDLSLRTDVTVNNVIIYGTVERNVLDAVHDDIYVSTKVVRGFLSLDGDDLAFNATPELTTTPVHTSTATPYINAADVVATTDEHLYLLKFSRSGLVYTKFDGINYDEFVVNVPLNSTTVNELCLGRHVTFDKVNNLTINLHDGDGLRSLKRVAIVNDEYSLVQLDKRLLAVYHAVEQATMTYISSFRTFTHDGVGYEVTFNGNYDVRDEHYDMINFNNTVQKFATLNVSRSLHFTVTLRTVNPTTGAPIALAASAVVTSTAIARVLDANQVVDVVNHFTEFTFGDTRFVIAADHVDNQNPPNIMECVNGQYYVKFERSTHSSTVDDYGLYRSCSLYRKTVKVCSIPLEAVYGDGCSQKLYKYGDFVNLRAVQLDKNTMMLVNNAGRQSLFTKINLSEDRRIVTVVKPSSLIFTELMDVGDRCLGELEHMLTGASQYASTPRSIRVFSVSDDPRQPSVVGLGDPVKMKPIDNIVAESNELATSWAASVNVDWPLNTKNRNSFLGTIDVMVVDVNQ